MLQFHCTYKSDSLFTCFGPFVLLTGSQSIFCILVWIDCGTWTFGWTKRITESIRFVPWASFPCIWNRTARNSVGALNRCISFAPKTFSVHLLSHLHSLTVAELLSDFTYICWCHNISIFISQSRPNHRKPTDVSSA